MTQGSIPSFKALQSNPSRLRFARVAGIVRRLAACGMFGTVERSAGIVPHVLVACQPKSGSTFLSRGLAALPRMRMVQLAPGFDRREHELCELQLRRSRHRAYVAQHHVRRSAVTDEYVQRFGLTVIVLVRDLFDVTVSLRDHLRQENVVMPMAYFEEVHRNLPDAELEAMIAQLAIPWYVNFYMSWRTCPYAHVVRYEEMIEDPVETVRSIAQIGGCTASESDIRQAIAGVRDARFNVGYVGRGRSLDRDVKRSIESMLKRYPAASGDDYVRRMIEAV